MIDDEPRAVIVEVGNVEIETFEQIFLTALLLGQILPVFSLVTPCAGRARPGPSGVSVQRGTFTTGLLDT